MPLWIAMMMAAAVCITPLSCLVAIGIFWIADRRGSRRPGRHIGRSHRTRAASRGHRPYRSGRVRMY